jgi:arginine exporter protein ArgO
MMMTGPLSGFIIFSVVLDWLFVDILIIIISTIGGESFTKNTICFKLVMTQKSQYFLSNFVLMYARDSYLKTF